MPKPSTRQNNLPRLKRKVVVQKDRKMLGRLVLAILGNNTKARLGTSAFPFESQIIPDYGLFHRPFKNTKGNSLYSFAIFSQPEPASFLFLSLQIFLNRVQ